MAAIVQPGKGFNLERVGQSMEQFGNFAANSLVNSANNQARATQDLAQRLAQVSNTLTNIGNKQMQREASDQATQDVLADKPRKVDLNTIYGQAYNSAAMATYNAEVGINAKIKASEYKLNANGDVELFENNYTIYENKQLAKAPNEESRIAMMREFKAYRETTKNQMLAENDSSDKNYQLGVLQKNLASTTTNVINAINADTPQSLKIADEATLKFANHVHALEKDNVISSTTRIKLLEDFHADVQRTTNSVRFEKVLNEDLVKAQTQYENFKKVIPEGMNATTHRVILSDMKSAIIHKVKFDKATAKATFEANDAIGEKVIKVLMTGKTPPNYKKALELKYSPKMTEKLNNAITFMSDTQSFNGMDIPSQADTITKLRDTANPTAEDVTRLQHLEKLYEYNSKMANSDPITLASEQGLETGIVQITPNNFGGLSERQRMFDRVEDYYGTKGKIFTQKEAVSLTASYNSGSPTQKRDILDNLTAQLEGKYLKSAINEISGKNNEHIKYNAIMMMGDRPDIADIAMQGENADIALPEGFKKSYEDYIGGAFGNTTDAYNIYMKGAANYYKGTALNGQQLQEADLFAKSVGVINDYNGKNVVVPIGVSIDNFERWMDTIDIPGEPALSEIVQDMPDWFGTGDAQLQSLGNGKYNIILNPKSAPIIAGDKDGNPIVIEYKAVNND